MFRRVGVQAGTGMPHPPARDQSSHPEDLLPDGHAPSSFPAIILMRLFRGETGKVTCWFVALLVSRCSYSSSIPMATTKRDTIL